jgi:hypothetical protein
MVKGWAGGLLQAVNDQLFVLYRVYEAWCTLKIYFKVILEGFPISSFGVAKGGELPTD